MKHAHSPAFAGTVATSYQPARSQKRLAFLDTLLEWHSRAAQRRHLRELDARLLSDMGISRSDADQESRKPFWRA